MSRTDVYTPQPSPLALLSAPGTYPVPAGRGRWRLTLHARQFASPVSWQNSIVAELPTARNRKLVQAWAGAAILTFDLDGQAAEAALAKELQHDVIAWRWDDTRGLDEPLFRGIIGQSADAIDEQSHVVTFTCHDYLDVINRRFLTATWQTPGYSPTAPTGNMDQDDIVSNLLTLAMNMQSGSGQSFSPASLMPIAETLVNPDGSSRSAKSGQLRVRNYLPQANIYTTLDELSKVQGGFDYDLTPGWRYGSDNVYDWLRIFYPRQGVQRGDVQLKYPGNVSTVKRTVDSGTYANYERVLGNNQSASATTAQLAGEAWNTDATAGAPTVGLWPDTSNASDVIDQPTVTQRAQGDLVAKGTLIPTYVLGLTPNFYYSGAVNMGDTVPLVVQSGRLNVNSLLRVMGIEYDVGDDGNEDIVLTVGVPDTSLVDMLDATAGDVEMLARR